MTEGKTCDVVTGIRATRIGWMGLILCVKPRKSGEERMIKKAVRFIYKHEQEGDILMDSSQTETWEELVSLMENKKTCQL